MSRVKNSPGLSVIRASINADPDMPCRTRARALYAKHPKLWPSLNALRRSIGYQQGIGGPRSRMFSKQVPTRPKRQAGDDWKKYLPEEKRTLKIPWEPVHIKGAHRVLALFDIHVPFHDSNALELAIEFGRKHDSTLVMLCGDALDTYALSRWQKNPELRDFPGEVRAGRQLLQMLRSAFPDARIIWKWGNHEERYDVHLRLNPDFYGLDDWEWPNVFRYKEHGIEHVGDKRPIVIGKGLHIIHGHEYGGGMSVPVNPARTYFLKAGVHVIGGHYHQSSQHSAKNLEQNVVSAWSSGCLCEEHPEYRPINNWSQGFVFIDVNKSGAFTVENRRIIDGAIW